MGKCYRMNAIVLVVTILLVLGCSGCGHNDSLAESSKVTITLATTEASRLDTEFIMSLNSGDYPFTIEIVDYQEQSNGDATQALVKLNKELAAGDGPDIIDLSAFEFDIASYAAKGIFEDLYPYIDEDEALDRTDIVETVLRTTEYNGTLPGIMSGFTIKTIATTNEIAQDRTTWSVPEFSDYIANIGSAFLLSEDAMDIESLLYTLSQTTFKSYVDYSTGTADFDNQEFIDFLTACTASDFDGNNSIKARIVSVGSFMEQQVLEGMMGDEIAYIGFPVLDEEESGSYINNQENYLAICSSSAHKDLCWEFIRCFLSEEYQDSKYIKEIETAFPTNKNSLNNLASYSMTPVYDEDNVEITERGMYGSTYEPANQSTVNQIMALIESVQTSQRCDPVALTELINEEVCSLLSGSQSAEKTAENIQNRASTLVSEYK